MIFYYISEGDEWLSHLRCSMVFKKIGFEWFNGNIIFIKT